MSGRVAKSRILRYCLPAMRSLDDPPRFAQDLYRLRRVADFFDYAELITQYPDTPERDKLARRLLNEASHLSALNMISRQERARVGEILSCIMPADAAAQ